MAIERLELEDFRCFHQARLDPDPRLSLITGKNASGKSSLLEAIFFLGRGKSFRAGRIEHLVRGGAEACTVFAQVQCEGRRSRLGMRGQRGRTEARIDGAPAATVTALAERLPVEVIDQDVHRLLDDTPSRRRRFIDWGVFHVEQGFLGAWRRFHRALKQRNAALRRGEGLDSWDAELVSAGEQVQALRGRYVERLRPEISLLGEVLLGEAVDVEFYPGWSRELSLRAVLAGNRTRDQERGITHAGPHRADLRVRVAGRNARQRVSRGQQKLLAAALVLAQGRLRLDHGMSPGVLLVDDAAAELDREALQRLLEAIAAQPGQLLMTALYREDLPVPAGRVFHVEREEVRQVV